MEDGIFEGGRVSVVQTVYNPPPLTSTIKAFKAIPVPCSYLLTALLLNVICIGAFQISSYVLKKN